MSDCVHEFAHDATPGSFYQPGKFRCTKCGLVVYVGGSVESPRSAHDESYRPDLPLKSTDANVAAWADAVRREIGDV
jgi:hypothetical protein